MPRFAKADEAEAAALSIMAIVILRLFCLAVASLRCCAVLLVVLP